MNQDPVTVERIDMLKAFPALQLTKALRLGFRLRILVPCLIGVACWLIVGEVSGLHALTNEVLSPWADLRSPVLHSVTICSMLLANERPDAFVSLLLSLLLDMAVMAVVGVAVAKAAAADFCLATRVGALAGVRFSFRNVVGWLLSTGLSLAIVCVLLGTVSFAAWLVSLGAAGTTVVSVLWPIVFWVAVLTTITAVVCWLSWLLSLAAIGTDQCSGSDALSRGINYVLSHKLTAIFYLVLTLLLSLINFALIKTLLSSGEAILRSRLPDAFFEASAPSEGLGQPALFYWNRLITGLLPDAIHFGTFLSAITLMYILLRQSEDAVRITEMDGAQRSTPKS